MIKKVANMGIDIKNYDNNFTKKHYRRSRIGHFTEKGAGGSASECRSDNFSVGFNKSNGGIR